MSATRTAVKPAADPRRAEALPIFVWEGTDKRGIKMKGEQPAKNANIIRAELRKQGITPGVVKVKPKPLFGGTGKRITPLDIAIYARPDYYFGYRSEAFNAAIQRAESATDQAAQNAAYAEAQRLLSQDAVNVFLFMLPKITVTRAGLAGMWESWPLPANPIGELSWR